MCFWVVSERNTQLHFSSSILNDGYKHRTVKGGILGVSDQQFLGIGMILVGVFSHMYVLMGWKSTDEVQKTRVLVLSPPQSCRQSWARLISESSIPLLMKQKQQYLSHRATPPIAFRVKENRELTFAEDLLYARQIQVVSPNLPAFNPCPDFTG